MSAVIASGEAPRLGIFFDEPPETYYRRRLEEASNSGLAVIDVHCPMQYHYWITNPDGDEEETAALRFGRAFHCATLEPEQFGDRYVLLPDDAPRKPSERQLTAQRPSMDTLRAIDWWRTWECETASRETLTRADYEQARAMANSLRAYEMEFPDFPGQPTMKVGELIDACQKEVTVRWIDEETGVLCKARADLYEPDLQFGGDIKSCISGAEEPFSRAIVAHRYHVQSTHYCEGFRVCGTPLKSFVFFPVEKRRPHVPASWHTDAPSEERGWAIRQRSIRKLDACLKSGRWPGHTTTVKPISIPAYGHYDSQDKAA
ncbi:PD-(D/E)XK nuclease-like domain-containing protein [Lysobacter sp. CA199]|uniref:PD-(D/E)XK nuclease-like domain-containing protein n=1 Tax=Lysobacter sp. CA199 TaxID=3455608 RepID=UPI003F8D8828